MLKKNPTVLEDRAYEEIKMSWNITNSPLLSELRKMQLRNGM